mgnify:CR=1 FL=1
MKYTYKISEHANSEMFSGLKSDIGYLYPEFVFEKEIKDADGSCTDFFRCEETGENIAAELSYANNNIVLTADMAMPELAEKYKIDKSEARENDNGISFEGIGFDFKGIIRALFCTSLGIKLFAVPLALIVLSAGYAIIWDGGDMYGVWISIFSAVGLLYVNILYCGGLFAIPTAALAWWLAVKKNNLSYKAPLFIFMIFSELHLLIFYCHGFSGLYIDDLAWIASSILLNLPYVLIMLYFFLLPVIIADEIVSRKHKKIYGKRAKGWQSAIWWGGTMVAMCAVLIVFGAVSSYIEISKVQDIAAEESISTYEVIDPLLEKHEKAMRTVSDYAAEYNYYDWYCCPDESVKEEWQELFVDESEYIFHYRLDDYDSPSFSVYINGEGRGRYDIRFEGEEIYVNEGLFNREEVGFSV